MNNITLTTLKAAIAFFCLSICNISFSKETSPGSPGRFIFNQISQEDGLLSTVNCICKGKGQYLWAGTCNGVYRLNGYEIRHYDTADTGSKIKGITYDADGKLWVLSLDGVSFYDASEDRFVQVTAEGEQTGPIMSCCTDRDGIYFGGKGKVFRYSYDDRRFSLFAEFPKNPSFTVSDITVIGNGKILCGDRKSGMRILEKSSRKISHAPFHCPPEIVQTLVSSDGNLWITCFNQGIYVFSPDGNEIAHYSTENKLSSNLVLCIEEHGSMIWAGTDGCGINIIDRKSGKVSVIEHSPDDKSSFPANSVTCLEVDEYGNIWAGSVRDGIINISQTHMKTFSDVQPGGESGLSNTTALCLWQEDGESEIWIGTDGEGINCFDPKTETFKHFPTTFNKKAVSIASYSANEFAVSLYAEGLFIFEKNTGRLSPMKITDRHLIHQLKYTSISTNLCNENDGSLLLLGGDIRRLDKKSGKTETIPVSDGAPYIGGLFLAGRDSLHTYFQDAKSIYRLETGAHSLERIFRADSSTVFNVAFLTSGGTMWLGTADGIARFNIRDREFETIRSDLFQAVKSIVADKSGLVWIGTDNRLLAYRTNTGSFAMFGRSDGVKIKEFLYKPRLLSENGDVYMGGVQGMLYIDHGFSIDTSETPEIILDETYIDDALERPDKDLCITVPYGSRKVKINVTAKEKDMFREKAYRFNIKSSCDDYFESFEPRLVLRPLPPPGKHEIYVSCTTRNGEWTVPVHLVTIDVEMAWYKRWWFILCYMSAAVAFTVWIFISALRRKEDRLNIEMKEKEKSASEDKVNFLINASHEMLTPLTLIIAPIKHLLKDTDSSSPHFEILKMVYRQANRMKEQLNTILDLRKMEMTENRLETETVEFNVWMMSILKDYITEGKISGITVQACLNPETGAINIDRRKCETVLTNLLINALRYSKAGSTVTVRSMKTGSGKVRVEVSDQGPGLQGIRQDKLFTRFYQGDGGHSGSGIGLSYAKILIELHGGKIGAINNEDSPGATFWFELPSDIPLGEIIKEPKSYLNKLIDSRDDPESFQDNMDGPLTDQYPRHQKIKLLVADDNQDFTEFIKSSFEKYAKVYTACSGRQAMDVLKRITPDIIISDVSMPDGDGYELCRFVKENIEYSHVPVILLTAQNNECNLREGYKTGAAAFLTKPFEVETLYELIKNILKERDITRHRYLHDFSVTGTEHMDFSAADERFLSKLNSFIEENLDSPDLDITLICKGIGISRALLYNKLKAITGVGANEYISRIRMNRAVRMVEDSDMSFVEIAEKVGFATASYFSTAFKKHTGMSPTQWREKHKLLP